MDKNIERFYLICEICITDGNKKKKITKGIEENNIHVFIPDVKFLNFYPIKILPSI